MSSKRLEYEPLIKDGSYSVIYHSHAFTSKFKDKQIVIYFQLAEMNEMHKNSIFSMWLNIWNFNKLKNGKYNFKVKKAQKFVDIWEKLFPEYNLTRFDRFPVKAYFSGVIFKAKIHASKKNYLQKTISINRRVSKVVDLDLCK